MLVVAVKGIFGIDEAEAGCSSLANSARITTLGDHIQTKVKGENALVFEHGAIGALLADVGCCLVYNLADGRWCCIPSLYLVILLGLYRKRRTIHQSLNKGLAISCHLDLVAAAVQTSTISL